MSSWVLSPRSSDFTSTPSLHCGTLSSREGEALTPAQWLVRSRENRLEPVTRVLDLQLQLESFSGILSDTECQRRRKILSIPFSLQVFLDCLSVLFMEATTFSKFQTDHLMGARDEEQWERGVLPSAGPTDSVWIWVYCPNNLLTLSSSYKTFMDVNSGDTNTDPFHRWWREAERE